jgi:hypothetical protein
MMIFFYIIAHSRVLTFREKWNWLLNEKHCPITYGETFLKPYNHMYWFLLWLLMKHSREIEKYIYMSLSSYFIWLNQHIVTLLTLAYACCTCLLWKLHGPSYGLSVTLWRIVPCLIIYLPIRPKKLAMVLTTWNVGTGFAGGM